MVSRRVYLTYKDDDITKPLIHDMSAKFDVVTNIRSASVEKGIGLVAVAVEGDEDKVDAALAWIATKGVTVEPIEKTDAI